MSSYIPMKYKSQFLSDDDELFTFLDRYCNCEVICYKLIGAFGMEKHQPIVSLTNEFKRDR